MGEQRNLTEENVSELKDELDRMQKENPDLEYRFTEQIERVLTKARWLTLDVVYDKLVELDNKLDRIFGGYVVINGQFQNISKKIIPK